MNVYHVAFSVFQRGIDGCKVLSTVVTVEGPITPDIVRGLMVETIRRDWPTETEGKDVAIVSWQRFDL